MPKLHHEFRPVLGKDTLAQQAYNTIRGRILDGTYPLGASISRTKIALELGMSSIPVHEALARLESEYLVENIPRSGTKIRVPTPQDLRGFFMVREALETQSARLFVRCASQAERRGLMATAAEVDHTRQRILELEERQQPAKLVAWRFVHMRFHRQIAECTGLPMLIEAVERNQLLVFNSLYERSYGDLQLPENWHQRLAASLCGSSERMAESEMRKHLKTRLDELLGCLERIVAEGVSRNGTEPHDD